MTATQNIARCAERFRAGARRALNGRIGRAWVSREWARLPKLIAEAETCREMLSEFGSESDKEFTALAKGLAQINERLAATRAEAAGLDRILQDRDEDRALSSAQTLYKNSVDLVHASVGTAVAEQEQLAQIDEKLLDACRAREKFKKNDLLLRILTMSFRMEAARMNSEFQAVFFNVAADIETIGEKIAATTETAFGRIEAVIAEARNERGDLKDLEHDLQEHAQRAIRNIEQELTELTAALAPCVEHSHAITEMAATIGPETLRVIGSLQHQDIVRQQLEHVAAGFRDLAEHFTGVAPAGAAREKQVRVELAYVHRATCVQQTHLRSAREEIDRAGTEVVAGLQALLRTGATLVERLTAMETTAGSTIRECRAVQNFKAQIRQLSQIAAKSKDANDKITHLVGRIEEVVRMFSEEIVQHEFDVMLATLNAQIAAARLPSAEALAKLAEETSHISADNTAVTCELTACLQASLGQLHKIKSDADEFLGIVTREKSDLETGMVAVSGKLDRMLESVHKGALDARRDFAAVHDDCRVLLERLEFPALIEQSFGRAERLCAELLKVGAEGADTSTLSAAAASRLQAHRDRYTMEKEDAAHAAAISRPAPVSRGPADNDAISQPGVPRAVPPNAADLGDGIELF
jgi:hypothetical protein